MTEKVLVTCAFPYANGFLHFGHIAGAYLPGDCYARYERLKGKEVLFVSSSDEYGMAVTLSAELAGRTPKEQVDFFHHAIKDFFKQINISFDHYSRTTWPGHAETTQEYFKDLYDNGYIEERITEQLYSEKDHKFLADRYVIGTCPKCGYPEARGDECQKCGASYEATDLLSPRSKLTQSPLVLKKTKHWFLRYDLFKEQLLEWISQKHWKPNVLNFAKSYIEEIRPRAITRDMSWGIPVPLPGAEGKVIYVWFDGCVGYISACREWAQKIHRPDAWKEYWCDPKTKLVQFIGKDNIPFHAVFFPAMTMGQNQPYKIVDELPANEFYNLEGRQFSKSDGWFIDIDSFFKKFTADQIRYAIASNAPETQDAEFTWKDFQARCNHELLGKYGNFVNRTLVFAQKYCSGTIPELNNLNAQDREFLDKVKQLAQEADTAYAHFRLRKASQIVMELAQLGNVYFDAKKPWALAKSLETQEEMHRAIGCCLQCIATLALISSPIVPTAAEKIWKMLGQQSSLEKGNWTHIVNTPLNPHTPLPEPEILFAKIEDESIQEEIDKLKPKSTPAAASPSDSIEIDAVKKLDLRVAQVLHVEPVAKSKKLLKFTVDLGTEQRTIVSGVAEQITDHTSLVGRKLLVVTNLKPVTLMGIESQGMIFSAKWENHCEFPSFMDVPLGTPVL